VPGEGSTTAASPYAKSRGIDVLSWSFGVSNPVVAGPTGRGGSGRPNFSDFTVTKRVDHATPLFLQACANGKDLGTADFYLDAPLGGGPYVNYATFIFEKVVAVSCAVTSNGVGGAPSQTVSFRYSRVKIDYTGATTGTTTSFNWNLATNRSL